MRQFKLQMVKVWLCLILVVVLLNLLCFQSSWIPFYMFHSCLVICYQYIEYVLITIVGSSLMPIIFKFKTKPHEGSFTRPSAVMDFILFLPLPNHLIISLRQLLALDLFVHSNVWHSQFGHPSNSTISLMIRNAKVSCPKDVVPLMCQSCLEDKFTKLSFQSSKHHFTIPFEIVRSDLWGLVPCNFIDGYKYYVTINDECTRFCWLLPLINRLDFFASFLSFCAFVKNQFSTSVTILETDGEGMNIWAIVISSTHKALFIKSCIPLNKID